MGNMWGTDYFISIHCNSGVGTGVESLNNRGIKGELSKALALGFYKYLNLILK